MATFVFSKIGAETAQFQADLSTLLQPGETITSITAGPVTPLSNAPTVTILSGTDPLCIMQAVGGSNGLAYGYQLTITTNAQVLIAQCAISVTDTPFVPYTTQNPDAFVDLVDTIEAGKAAMAVALFQFPPQIDPSGGFVTWELLASDGTVYAAGNAFEVKIISNGLSNTVRARCIINVPSTVPPTLLDQKYQLQYTLQLPIAQGTQPDVDQLPTQGVFITSESVTVTGLNTVPLGVQPQVEIKGVPAKMSIVVDDLYDNVGIELYWGNDLVVGFTPIAAPERTSNGWYYAGVINTSQLMISLVPYTVVWKYWNNSDSSNVVQETANLWIINSSISTAISDVQSKVQKARATLYGTPDLLFPPSVILTWLRRGMDYFNGAFGKFTSIDMTAAQGPVREYWLMCSEVFALQSQELAEAEKAFDFQGAAISLSVDRTAAYGGLADKIQGRLDNELKDFKVNLIIKGNTSGDGSADPGTLRKGAIGSVGITITPASAWGAWPALTQVGLR